MRPRFNRSLICRADENPNTFRTSRRAHTDYLREQHEKNKEFLESIPKRPYTRCFGKLIPLTAEGVMRCQRSGMPIIYN